MARILVAAILTAAAASWSCDRVDPLERIEASRHPSSRELVAALKTGPPARRSRAALAMGRIQSPAYFAPLTEAVLGAGQPEVRLGALFAIGQLGLAADGHAPDETVEACRAMLADPDDRVVVGAVEALGKLADPVASGALVPMLDHPSPTVRAAAAYALFRVRFVPVWRGETAEPPRLPDDAVRGLVHATRDDSPDVRRAAAYAMSRYGQPEAAQALGQLVGDADEWTRLFSVRALGRSGEAAVGQTVAVALRDPSPRVRTEAVTAIARLGAAADLPLESSEDPSFHVRAAWAAAQAGAARAAPVERLERLLADDTSPTVRGAALESLAALEGEAAAPRVDRLSADPDWRLRAAAARAAAHLGDAAMDRIRAAVADSDARVRAAALRVFEGRDDGDEMILAALGSEDLAERGTAVELLATSSRADKVARLREVYDASGGVEWTEIRETIAGALEARGPAVSLLERMAHEDPAPSVRRRALAELEAPPPKEPGPRADTTRFDTVRFDADPVVVLETTKGPMRIRCFASDAPVHVASFVELVRDGFYDGSIWHRVVPNFVIQGGDPRGDGWGGAGYTIRDEISTRRFERGTVGMPKAGKDTGGGQIFITHVPTPHLDGNYTAFGRVVDGLEVIDRIEIGDVIERARLE